MREHEMYRPVLEDILAYSKGKRMLTITEVSKYVGHKNEWCKKYLGVPREGISAMALAKKLAADYSGM